MKITDMNLICLEECFENLELRDLLRVADANKRLRKAAEFVYHQKYGQLCVSFRYFKNFNPKYLVFVYESEISFEGDLKASFQILRCFGHLVKEIEFNWGEKYKAEVFDYINKYCADSLVKINIIADTYPPKAQNIMFPKSFTRVEEVKIYNCHLAVNGEEFDMLFPKLKKLEYSGMKENDISALVYHYPYLEDLSIDMRKHTTSILHLNPQLKKLILYGDHGYICDEDEFRNSIEPMQKLEELKMTGYVAEFFKFNGKKIKLKNVKKFEVSGFDDEQKYPFLFEQLEFLDIDGITITPHVYDFIEQHPSIKELHINSQTQNIDRSRIRKALPLLTKFTVFTG